MGWLLTGPEITPNFDKRSGFRPCVLSLGSLVRLIISSLV
jgi:hypothetical protein